MRRCSRSTPALPYKTFKDLQNAKEELVIGTTGPGSNSHDVPLLLKEFAGAKFRLVAGYAANTDIKLALERREVDGWTALATTVRMAGEQGIVRPMVRSSRASIDGSRSSSRGRGSGDQRHRPRAHVRPRNPAWRSAGRSACGLERRPTARPRCATRWQKPSPIQNCWPR